MDIFKTIHPACLALSPYAVAARAVHQLPILWKNKQRDLSYHKYEDNVLPADVRFVDDVWQSFQFFEWSFTGDFIAYDTFVERMDIWSLENFKVKSNCIQYKGRPKSYVDMITRKKPSEIIRNHTHLLMYFPKHKTIAGFMDHYYCDGHSLMDYFRKLFIEENPTFPKMPSYTYYPFLSDAMAIQLLWKQCIECVKYPSQVIGVDDKLRVLSKKCRPIDNVEWNRWTVYALGVLPLFESMPGVDYLRVGLTVGFDTDQTFGNNRIGTIFVRVIRPKQPTHNERICDLMEQFKTQATANYTEAHTTYDVLRGYDVSYVRRFGVKKTIDIVFTSLYFKEAVTKMKRGIGGFVGAFSEYEFLYVNAVSTGPVTNLTYVSNVKQIDYQVLTNNGMKIEYEFDNTDAGQY